MTLGALLGLAVVVGLLSGAYPAAVLSGFRPMAVLGHRLSVGWSAGMIRKAFVVVQFALAIVLMNGVYVLHEQLRFATNLDARQLPRNRLTQPSQACGPHDLQRDRRGDVQRAAPPRGNWHP